MRRIVLPGTNLETSRLGFGTASLHHVLRSEGRETLLRAALDAGITHFDTARMYGDGMAERSLGSFLRDGVRPRVTLASKVGIPASRLNEAIPPAIYFTRAVGSVGRRLGLQRAPLGRRYLSEDHAEDSLRRTMAALGTDWLDILFVHEPDPTHRDEVARLAPWLERQKASGRVRYLGLAGGARACVGIHRALPGLFEILQVQDSLRGREADECETIRMPIQITYGYYRGHGQVLTRLPSGESEGKGIILAAMARNPKGMVLFSTRRVERVKELAEACDEGPIR